MSCHRKGCDEIMCNTYIQSLGYICGYCQTEFKNYLATHNLTPETEGQINKELKIFMETEKDDYTEGKKINVDDYFNENTKH